MFVGLGSMPPVRSLVGLRTCDAGISTEHGSDVPSGSSRALGASTAALLANLLTVAPSDLATPSGRVYIGEGLAPVPRN